MQEPFVISPIEYENFVFSGGGVLGIAYLGMLDYLYSNHVMQKIRRVAGASAGAITACIISFNLPFAGIKDIIDTLDFSKVPDKTDTETPSLISKSLREQLDWLLGDVSCVYRLVNHYGWFSSQYFYEWIKEQIAHQFDAEKKAPPYTFSDFRNTDFHLNGRPFKDLYITGTDVTSHQAKIFSYETTPDMEVAMAVRISMSVPLFFEAVESKGTSASATRYADGGLMYNYPIDLFDQVIPPFKTIGAYFKSDAPSIEIKSLLDYIVDLVRCIFSIQSQYYQSNPLNMYRSIQIPTGDISFINFDIKKGDSNYNYLYKQGYNSAKDFFTELMQNEGIVT